MEIHSCRTEDARSSLGRSETVTAVRIQDQCCLSCGSMLFGTCLLKYMAPHLGDHNLEVKRLPTMLVMFVCLWSGVSPLTVAWIILIFHNTWNIRLHLSCRTASIFGRIDPQVQASSKFKKLQRMQLGFLCAKFPIWCWFGKSWWAVISGSVCVCVCVCVCV
jgi:hypothetical protein